MVFGACTKAGHGVGIDIVQNLAVKFPAFWLLRTEEGMPSYMCRVTLTEKNIVRGDPGRKVWRRVLLDSRSHTDRNQRGAELETVQSVQRKLHVVKQSAQ